MQDVHWPCGRIGYFPAYTFGAMGAAQLFAAAIKAKPEIKSELGRGEFKTLLGWLRENVHSKGSLLTQDQLFTAATGETLNANYFLNSLSRRYLGRDYTP
jgi:carboxypeptidase Taq